MFRATVPAQENTRLIESLQRSNKALLAANEELRKTNRDNSEFIARLSHDMRTPLNVIIGFTELLLDEIPGEINEDQRQDLNDILNSSKRLLELADSLLERP